MKFLSVLSFRKALGQPLSMLSFKKTLGQQYQTKLTSDRPKVSEHVFQKVSTLHLKLFRNS
jgi:hypothetical protein